MTEYTDLEIGIHQRGSEGYYTEIRFTNPEDENDSTAIAARAAQFDQDFMAALREQELDPLAYGQILSDTLEEAYLDELFAKVGEIQRAKFPNNPYKVLAELPFSVYVTTNLSNLLVAALVAAGKEPRKV